MTAIVEEYMLQTCTIRVSGAPDAWGQESVTTTYSAQKCRFWIESRMLKTADGELISCGAVLQLPAGATIAAGCEVDVDGGTYHVLQVIGVPDITGAVDHQICYLGADRGARAANL